MLKQRDLILFSHYYEGFSLSIFEIIKKTTDITNLIKSSIKQGGILYINQSTKSTWTIF